MKELKDYVGGKIALLSPVLHETIIEEVTLHGVESGGIWIESQKMTNATLEAMRTSMAPRTLVFFLPWHQVTWIMSAIDVPALSHKLVE